MTGRDTAGSGSHATRGSMLCPCCQHHHLAEEAGAELLRFDVATRDGVNVEKAVDLRT